MIPPPRGAPNSANMAAGEVLAEDIAEDNEALVDSSQDSALVTVAETREFSIDDAVESLGFGAFHLLIVLFCGIGWVRDLGN